MLINIGDKYAEAIQQKLTEKMQKQNSLPKIQFQNFFLWFLKWNLT